MDAQKQKELIARVMEHKDQQAFEELVVSIHRKCMMIMYKYTIPFDDQKDIFQETCIRLWVYLADKKFQEKAGGFDGLMARITTNLCIDYLRLKKKHNKVSIDTFEFEKKDITIQIPQYDDMFTEEDRKNLQCFVKSLPRNQRVVYHLRMSKGKSFREIANHLQISINTALGRMRYIRANFEKNRHKFNL